MDERIDARVAHWVMSETCVSLFGWGDIDGKLLRIKVLTDDSGTDAKATVVMGTDENGISYVLIERSCARDAKIAELERENAAMRGVLARLQWNGSINDAVNVNCPICGHVRSIGKHGSDCELAKMIGGTPDV